MPALGVVLGSGTQDGAEASPLFVFTMCHFVMLMLNDDIPDLLHGMNSTSLYGVIRSVHE